jgi:hypothetical protein
MNGKVFLEVLYLKGNCVAMYSDILLVEINFIKLVESSSNCEVVSKTL